MAAEGRKLVLITGGTGSLGRATASAVEAEGGWTVAVTGRRAVPVAEAAAGIGPDAVGLPLDLGSLADVRRFAAELTGRGLPPLHAIVCNAGIQTVSGTTQSADGFEETFAVNHLAHFLLVQLLLPHLRTPARIVFVASGTHDPTKHTGMPAPIYTDARSLARAEPVPGEPASLTGRRRYATSKLCNVLTTYELARRLTGPGITVNAFDPGLMPGTGLARDYGPVQSFAWRYVLPALTLLPGLNAHTPRRSGASLARLVLDPALADTTGRYFEGRREIRSSPDSYDRAKAAELFETSLGLAGLAGA